MAEDDDKFIHTVNQQYGYENEEDTSWLNMIVDYLHDKRSAVQPKLRETV